MLILKSNNKLHLNVLLLDLIHKKTMSSHNQKWMYKMKLKKSNLKQMLMMKMTINIPIKIII